MLFAEHRLAYQEFPGKNKDTAPSNKESLNFNLSGKNTSRQNPEAQKQREERYKNMLQSIDRYRQTVQIMQKNPDMKNEFMPDAEKQLSIFLTEFEALYGEGLRNIVKSDGTPNYEAFGDAEGKGYKEMEKAIVSIFGYDPDTAEPMIGLMKKQTGGATAIGKIPGTDVSIINFHIEYNGTDNLNRPARMKTGDLYLGLNDGTMYIPDSNGNLKPGYKLTDSQSRSNEGMRYRGQ